MAHIEQELKKNEFDLAKSARQEAQKISHKIGDFSEDVANRVESMAHEVKVKTNDYIYSSRQYVKEHPIQSVAIAAATGLAVGSILTMVRKTRQFEADNMKRKTDR